MRRYNGFFVTATDTDVGKTYVTAGLAACLWKKLRAASDNAGIVEAIKTDVHREDVDAAQKNEKVVTVDASTAANAAANVTLWKPVQSGAVLGTAQADSCRLVMGSGLPQTEQDTVTYTFPEPLAPWKAAERAGAEIDYTALVNEGRRRLEQRSKFLIIEGAGGFMVPLTGSRLIADFAAELMLPVLIIARPGLGTVNHTLLTIKAAQDRGLEVRGVILNGTPEEDIAGAAENAQMIEAFGGVPVLGILPKFDPEPAEPASHSLEAWRIWRERWTAVMEREFNWDLLLKDSYIDVIKNQEE